MLSQVWDEAQVDEHGYSMIRWWLLRARRLIEMKALVQGILQQERKPFCFSCGRADGLEVEQLHPLDELMAQFEKQEAAGFPSYAPGFRQLRRNEQWRNFFRLHQKFRTRCKPCILKDTRNAHEEISADEESEGHDQNAPTSRFVAAPSLCRSFHLPCLP
mgnify:CR=1 FL=1